MFSAEWWSAAGTVAGALITLFIALIAALLLRRQKQMEALVQRRLEVVKEVAEALNGIYCFSLRIGDWRTSTVAAQVDLKRRCDRVFHAHAYLFGASVQQAYDAFVAAHFRSFTGRGHHARLRLDPEDYWEIMDCSVADFQSQFESKGRLDKQARFEAYWRLMQEIARSAGAPIWEPPLAPQPLALRVTWPRVLGDGTLKYVDEPMTVNAGDLVGAFAEMVGSGESCPTCIRGAHGDREALNLDQIKAIARLGSESTGRASKRTLKKLRAATRAWREDAIEAEAERARSRPVEAAKAAEWLRSGEAHIDTLLKPIQNPPSADSQQHVTAIVERFCAGKLASYAKEENKWRAAGLILARLRDVPADPAPTAKGKQRTPREGLTEKGAPAKPNDGAEDTDAEDEAEDEAEKAKRTKKRGAGR